MKPEEVKAYIEYAQANAGQIQKTCVIEQGVATILGRSIIDLYHEAAHFTATRAF